MLKNNSYIHIQRPLQQQTGVNHSHLYLRDWKKLDTLVKSQTSAQYPLVYNWGGGGGFTNGNSGGNNWDDIIGNYFIAGPNSTANA
ncbi:hypothetical protein BC938DRAFT_480741 [Jimgerdemannia flammicorona]|uniref:Uncharacterized protein n=1 Tax=Jimgerdemannia flammicorona TaxID=994334 RepID=A0A433QX45_9FUNG|nr:hypothetical protein BC938DRAFT_480741 [Jimgerdemannia flammicorona]